ncbi:MAG: 4-(cytidine 5'-diphospho)-2-C-methyl-D-erythritol kinase, partial [Leptospiraceae bacterium]|nr:4-(cytidine 5'-diphospho)-2-C-methyl-D-erythritol kinase [Leptospiraceae bacterium]
DVYKRQSVLYKRLDGYHEISSIFLRLKWGDLIRIEQIPKNEFHLYSILELEGQSREDYLKISEKGDITKNILYKAWTKAKEFKNINGVKIQITKRIPTGAGLGGGSSNAATLLKFFFPNETESPEFLKTLASLGADVPFFWKDSHQIVSGIGEVLEDIQIPKGYGILALPELVISTKEAFLSLKRDLQKEGGIKTWKTRGEIPKSFSQWEDFLEFIKTLENDFEPYAFVCYPELEKLKANMQELGLDYVSMTGTGSSFYGISNDSQFIGEIYPKLVEKFPKYRFVQFEF